MCLLPNYRWMRSLPIVQDSGLQFKRKKTLLGLPARLKTQSAATFRTRPEWSLLREKWVGKLRSRRPAAQAGQFGFK